MFREFARAFSRESPSRRSVSRGWSKSSSPSSLPGSTSPLLYKTKMTLGSRGEGEGEAQGMLRRGRRTTMQRRPDKWEMLSQEVVEARGEPKRDSFSEEAREGKRMGGEEVSPTTAPQDAAHYCARRDGAMQTTLPRCSGCNGFCIAALFLGHQFLENSHVAHLRPLPFTVYPPGECWRKNCRKDPSRFIVPRECIRKRWNKRPALLRKCQSGL